MPVKKRIVRFVYLPVIAFLLVLTSACSGGSSDSADIELGFAGSETIESIGSTITTTGDSTIIDDWQQHLPASSIADPVFSISKASPLELVKQMPFINENSQIVIDPVPFAEGLLTLTIKINSAAEPTTAQSYSYTIKLEPPAPNRAPTFVGGPDIQTIADGSNFEQVDWASDSTDNDGGTQTLTFETVAVEHPEYFEVLPALSYPSHALSFRAKLDIQGITNVSIRLKDSGGTLFGGQDTSEVYTFSISFGSVSINHKPSFTVGQDITIPVNHGVFEQVGWACCGQDNDNNTQNLLFKIVENSAPQLFDEQPRIIYPSYTLQFTPKDGVVGIAHLKAVIVDDGSVEYGGQNQSEAQDFSIEIFQPVPNSPPSFIAGEDVTVANTTGAVALPGWATNITDNDNNTQTLRFEILSNSDSSLFLDQPHVDLPSGTLRFSTNPAASGHADIELQLIDDGGIELGGSDRSGIQQFRITTTGKNHAPIADSLSYITEANLPLEGVLNGSDVDADTLTYQLESQPVNGTLTLQGKQFVYTPNNNFTGNDGFNYTVSDGKTSSQLASISIRVEEPTVANTAPVANPITIETNEDSSKIFDLLGSDANGDPLTYIIQVQPASGELKVNGKTVEYIPLKDSTGEDSFTFLVNDGLADSDIASVTINVLPLNDAPVASDSTYSIERSTSLSITLLATDVDSQQLSYRIDSAPANGSATLDHAELTYTPDSGFVGQEIIRFIANDGEKDSASASITIDVQETNSAPTAEDISVTLDEDHSIIISLPGKDADGDSLTYALDTQPDSGSAKLNGDTVSYQANSHYHGTDSFLYSVSDGDKTSSAMVFVVVTSVNDVPFFTSTPALSADQGQQYRYALNATDQDGDTLTYHLLTGPAGMTLDSASNTVLWTPTYSQSGDFPVEVKVTDPDSLSDTQQFSINVVQLNRTPVISSSPLTNGITASVYRYQLLAEDADGDALTYSLQSAPPGMRINASTGLVEWQPAQEFALPLGVAENRFCNANERGSSHSPSVDFSLLVDESDSMQAAHAWLKDLVPAMQAVYLSNDIGTKTDNEYGLVAYLAQANPVQIAGKDRGSYLEILQGLQTLSSVESEVDGYSGIDYTINNYPQRAASSQRMLLVTDTNREIKTAGLDFDGILAGLQANNTTLSAIIPVDILCENGDKALGMTHKEIAIQADGAGGYTSCGKATIDTSSGNSTAVDAKTSYADLAIATGGSVWTFAHLANGGFDAISLSRALVDFEAQDTRASLPLVGKANLEIDNVQETVDNLTISVRNNGLADTESRTLTLTQASQTASFVIPELQPGRSHTISVFKSQLGEESLQITLADSSYDCVNPKSSTTIPFVKVNVSDANGAQTSQGFFLVSSQVNTAPEITSTPVTESAVGVSYIYSVDVSDNAGDSHFYELLQAPDGMIVDPYRGVIHYTPTDSAIGAQTVEISVTDLAGVTTRQQYTLNVAQLATSTELGPRFSSNLDDIGFVQSAMVSQINEVVPNNSLLLTFKKLVGPDECTTDNQTGEVSCQFADQAPEYSWLYLEVRDQYGRTDLKHLKVNQAPDITTTSLNDASYSRNYSSIVEATDADNDPFSVTLKQAPDGLLINNNVLEWIPGEKYADTVQSVTIAATDIFDSVTEKTFNIIVYRNRVPVASNEPMDFYVVDRNYSFRPAATDLDGDSLSYTFTSTPSGASTANSRVTWTQDAADKPSFQLSYTISDDFGGLTTVDKTVFVYDNRAPVWTSEQSIIVQEGKRYFYTMSATDADNDAVTYELISGPSGMAKYGYHQLEWTPAFRQLGVHSVLLRAQDAYGGSTEFTLTVNVGENQPPEIISSPVLSIISGHPYTSRNTAVDEDNDYFTFSLETYPGGMTVDYYNNGYTRWTPTSSQIGTHDVTLVATNSVGGKRFQSYQVTVTPNHAPVATFTPPSTAITGHKYETRVTGTDEDGDSVRFALVNGPEGIVVSPYNNGLLSWTPSEQQVGDNPVSIKVYDGYGGETVVDFTINVTNNTSPELRNLNTTWQLVVGTKASNYFNTFDDEGDFIDVTLAPDSDKPDNLNSSSSYLSWTPTADQVGEHRLILLASDNRGGETRYTINATVYNALTFIQIPDNAVLEAGQYTRPRIQAAHPAGLTPIYTMITGPQGLTLGSTGYFDWLPTDADIGQHTVTVEASTSDGQTITTTFTLEVTATNLAPVVDAIPDQTATAGNPWSLQISASDPESGPLRYAFSQLISDITIDPDTGLISLTPSRAQIGQHIISVLVTDDFNRYTAVSFNLTIGERDNTSPVISSTPISNLVAGTLYEYEIIASDADDDSLSYALVSGPANATLTNNIFAWTPTLQEVGTHTVVVSVDDSFGAVEQTFSITVAANNTGPVLEIHSPTNGQSLSGVSAVIVTVQDAQLTRWRLLMRSVSAADDDWIELATGSTEQVNAEIIEIDPNLYFDGQYQLLLIAKDSFGAETQISKTIVLDNNIRIGNFAFSVEDISIPMAGIPIQVTRTYDSRRRTEPLGFGYGWSVNYQNARLETSRVLGEHWTLNQYASGPLGETTEYCVESSVPPIVTVALPDGKVEKFETTVSPRCSQDSSLLDVSIGFEADPQTTSSLEIIGDNSARLVNQQTLVDTSTLSETIDPVLYQLTTLGGYIYRFDKGFGIRQIEDPNGNVLTYTDNGIVHSSGKALRFLRDSDNRIVRIVDPKGNEIKYNYDINGNLISSTDRTQATISYSYNLDHGLVEMRDPLGRTLVKNTCDTDGRLIAQEDENAEATTFSYNLAGHESSITDRLGRTTIFYYDERGNITSEVDALGEVTSYSYDANNNQLSKTDALGNISSTTFDAQNNPLTHTDGLGNSTTSLYNALGKETRITNALGNSYDKIYDAAGNLLKLIDPLGNETTTTFDNKGLVTSITDAEGQVTSFSYDSYGNKITETDREGNTLTYSYDANNNLISASRSRTVASQTQTETRLYTYDARDRVIETEHFDGSITKTEYDAAGNIAVEIDAKGRRTQMTYDAYGRLLSTTYPDGTTESKTYNAMGNLLTETDRKGHTTSYSYDALNRLTVTTYPDNSTSETVFDAIGRVIEEIDELGNSTTYSYDAAGRRISTTDALNNTTTFEYDANDNLIKQTDAKGRVTEYVYNALNQRIQTIFDDGSSIDTVYDKLGRQIETIDQNGRSTTYAYDGLGRLISVTDALDQVTSYTYDEVGNKLSQTDTMGRTTTWTYDAMGRELTHTLPLGQIADFTYDNVGNQTVHQDFNRHSHTYSYDANTDRLIQENRYDGSTVSYTYDNTGLRIGATDSSGDYSYTYDNRDRLIQETKPDGTTLDYTYDAAGNKLSLTSTVNGVVTNTNYTYDALNRLKTVIDANGITTYYYDAVGNRSAIDHSNGARTEYNYDNLNRVTQVLHKDALDNTLASFDYTLDATGRRTQVVEADGRATNYGYDELYRLTSETVTGPINDNYSASYQYDMVGNRTYATINGIPTAYTYDDNDRLTQQGGTSYTYDDNGNTLSKATAVDLTTYQWDSSNRLIQSTATTLAGSATSTFAYDMDDNRIAKTFDDGVSSSIVYIVDNNQDDAEVLHEVDSETFTINVSYTYADELLAQYRSGQSQTHHYDGPGNTRLLTDASGNTTNTYQYEVFGDLTRQSGFAENNYLFAGKQYDWELDQYYLRKRYYDQTTGRFTGMDSRMGKDTIPLTLNKYTSRNTD